MSSQIGGRHFLVVFFGKTQFNFGIQLPFFISYFSFSNFGGCLILNLFLCKAPIGKRGQRKNDLDENLLQGTPAPCEFCLSSHVVQDYAKLMEGTGQLEQVESADWAEQTLPTWRLSSESFVERSLLRSRSVYFTSDRLSQVVRYPSVRIGKRMMMLIEKITMTSTAVCGICCSTSVL